LILLKLRHSSWRVLFFLSAATNSGRPPSLMKFWARLRTVSDVFIYRASASAMRPSAAI